MLCPKNSISASLQFRNIIKILKECGLVTINQVGRERFCEARLDKLCEVSVWVAQYKKFWEAKLDSLDGYLNQLQTENTKKQTKNGK